MKRTGRWMKNSWKGEESGASLLWQLCFAVDCRKVFQAKSVLSYSAYGTIGHIDCVDCVDMDFHYRLLRM